MTTPAPHAALFRNDHGGLEVRHYETATDAAAVSQARELPSMEEAESVRGWKGRDLRHTAFARKLGVTPRLIRQVYRRGGLPGAKEHSAYILMVPAHLLRLAQMHGLKAVEQMARAGRL